MGYDKTLAQMFKDRVNKEQQEAVKGVVLNTDPLQIGIYNNAIILQGDLIYKSNSLSKHKGTCEINGQVGTCEIDLSLKKDDHVICVPTAKGQKWYIIERV